MVGIIGYMSGGKSYFAVEQILKYLSQGHRVTTNIRLKCQAVTEFTGISCVFWKQLYYFLTDTPSGYHQILTEDYSSYPHGSPRGSSNYTRNLCYVFLDEASSIFDSMVHATDSSISAVAAWARHTEKRGIIVYLIMQFESELHKRLRVHVTQYVKCVNTSTIKLPLLGCGMPWFLRGYSMRRSFLPDGETPNGPIKMVPFDKRVYSCYDTAQIVVGANDVAPFVPLKLNRDVAVFRQWYTAFILFCLCWFSILAFSVGWVISHEN